MEATCYCQRCLQYPATTTASGLYVCFNCQAQLSALSLPSLSPISLNSPFYQCRRCSTQIPSNQPSCWQCGYVEMTMVEMPPPVSAVNVRREVNSQQESEMQSLCWTCPNPNCRYEYNQKQQSTCLKCSTPQIQSVPLPPIQTYQSTSPPDQMPANPYYAPADVRQESYQMYQTSWPESQWTAEKSKGWTCGSCGREGNPGDTCESCNQFRQLSEKTDDKDSGRPTQSQAQPCAIVTPQYWTCYRCKSKSNPEPSPTCLSCQKERIPTWICFDCGHLNLECYPACEECKMSGNWVIFLKAKKVKLNPDETKWICNRCKAMSALDSQACEQCRVTNDFIAKGKVGQGKKAGFFKELIGMIL